MPSSILNLKFKGNKSFVAFSNLGDSESLTKTWKVCTKVASYLEQGQRLENLSWRLWHLQNIIVETDNAKSKREFRRLSKNMGDKLDKEKGRSIEELEAPGFRKNQAAEKLRQRAEEKEREREAHHNGRPLNRMQFTFSVDQPKGTCASPASAMIVKKPDLKPSQQFKDAHIRRTRAGVTRSGASASINSAANGSNASAAPSRDANDKDPPSLTQIGRRASPPPSSGYAAMGMMDDDEKTWHDDARSTVSTATTTTNLHYSDAGLGNNLVVTHGYNAHGAPTISLRFPSIFGTDFGPEALLFPQPSLMTPLSYGEDALSHAGAAGSGSHCDDDRFTISRPTIEVPLDEILNEVNMGSANYDMHHISGNGGAESPGAWSSSDSTTAGSGAGNANGLIGLSNDNMLDNGEDDRDIEMSYSNVNDPDVSSSSSPSSYSNLPSVPPMSQAAREALPATIHPAQVTSGTRNGASSGKPSLTVKTSPMSANIDNSSSVPRSAQPSASSNGVGSSLGVGGSNNSNSSAPGGVKAECSNCGATHTPLWRRGLNDELNCNACGLYCKLHKRPRPKSMRNSHGEGKSQSNSRSDGVDAGEPAQCYNCHTMATPLWRKDDEGKTVCNACGLYFKLHGSARPISMKSDVIRKRSRHDARRITGETPSASPGASRRASPVATSGHGAPTGSPILAPDSSTAPTLLHGLYYADEYDFSSPNNTQSELMGALGTDPHNSGVYSASPQFDAYVSTGPARIPSPFFPGPYHPDYLQKIVPDYSPYTHSTHSSELSGGVDLEDNSDRQVKRRRMSIDSTSEPPSSTSTSYSPYSSESQTSNPSSSSSRLLATAAHVVRQHQRQQQQRQQHRGSFDFSGYGSGFPVYASSDSMRATNAFWHPPMLPQEKSPGSNATFNVHPPMLPNSSTNGAASTDDFPMDFLHPPMLVPSAQDDDQLFAAYLHPPMVLNADDSPMGSLSSLHPPMLPESLSQHQQQQHHHGCGSGNGEYYENSSNGGGVVQSFDQNFGNAVYGALDRSTGFSLLGKDY